MRYGLNILHADILVQDGIDGQSGQGLASGFLLYVFPVCDDRSRADVQVVGYLLVGQSLYQQGKHFYFACGKVRLRLGTVGNPACAEVRSMEHLGFAGLVISSSLLSQMHDLPYQQCFGKTDIQGGQTKSSALFRIIGQKYHPRS